ncbi:hypothetical protein L2Y94_00720 [Luteibacter aegosomatis]|uniref:hypothetical protein n=1 Tax=Luteibacter aegosomatis TaxID=2911537 RepID=UPI001FFB3332|nr:hypothetical protein [Luteibacter aegosomatis]UPG85920.1 hypothetical protein L2Y94_00720 [Luteibacter aegosomatis]
MNHRWGVVVLLAAMAEGCAPVTGIGARGGDADVPVKHIDVVSLLPLHPAADARLRDDTVTFADTLARRLRASRFDSEALDVSGLVRRHDLPVEIRVRDDGTVRHLDGVLPEKALLALPADREGHRLVLFPARLATDRRTGVVVGTVHWRLDPPAGGASLARGILRYTVDARGFPGRRLAGELVAELQRQGVRGGEGALD